MRVNLFLSRDVWTRPLNDHGVRQHVFALYEEVFRGHDVRVYPQGQSRGTIADGWHHAAALRPGEINVLCPDYPVVAGALASGFRRDLQCIVHTWKVPGHSDDRLTARIHDILLRRVIRRARAVVVASVEQKRQLEAQGTTCPVLFAPVSVDSDFWRPDPPDLDDLLARFGLRRQDYVLTVGGSDRDDLYAAHVARAMKLRFVRATYSAHWAEHARQVLLAAGLLEHASILVNPSHVELRALYAGSTLLCLPTVTRTNPAGLTSLVEGMACGTVVAIPEVVGRRYVSAGDSGLFLNSSPDAFVRELAQPGLSLDHVRSRARTIAQTQLSNDAVAFGLRDAFRVNQLLGD